MTEKKCSTCQQTKPVTAFGRATGKRDGLTSRCKECTRIATGTPCKMCGKPKDVLGAGKRFCSACQDLALDAAKQQERERGIRRAREKREAHVKRPFELAPEGKRWCGRCAQYLPLANFKKGPTKINSYCVPCAKQYMHERNLAVKFNLTPEQYEAMYDQQDGRCAICMRQPRTRRLAVDHNHKTGEIRGLLCSRCNKQVLGAGNESPSLLRRAARYLERPPAITGGSLESLGDGDEQERMAYLEEIETLRVGEVAIYRKEEVTMTLASLAALARVAGIPIRIGELALVPDGQQRIGDDEIADLIAANFKSELAGYGEPLIPVQRDPSNGCS